MERKRALEETAGLKIRFKKRFTGIREIKLLKAAYVEELIVLYIEPETRKERKRLEYLFWSEFLNAINILNSRCNVNSVFCVFVVKYLYDQDSPETLLISRAIAAYLMVLGPELFDDTSIVSENFSSEKNTKVERFSGWTIGERYSSSYLNECLLSNLFTSSIIDWDLSDMVLHCLENGHFEFMLFLLKYSHFELPRKYRYYFSCMTNYILRCCERILKENEIEHRVKFLDEKIIIKKLIKSRVFTLTRLSLLLYHTYFLLRYLMLGVQQNKRMSDIFNIRMKSLNIISKYTKEPDITIGEMEKFLGTFFNECETEVILEHLRNLHKQLSLNYLIGWNPRSLQDLTRCKIRGCFQKSIPIHEQISELKIPRPLKNFLLIYDMKMDEFQKIFERLVVDMHTL